MSAFLLPGFCPLRNTLIVLAHPASVVPKVPAYGKIIGQDDCVKTVVEKTVPTAGKTWLPRLYPAWLQTINSNACLSVSEPVYSGVKAVLPVYLLFPIYLHNRCLLI